LTLDVAYEQATVRRIGNTIGVAWTGHPLAQCGTATVTNTNEIRVTTSTVSEQGLHIDMGGGRFQPGKTAEPSGISEIEFTVNLGSSTDYVQITGGSSGDNIRIGALGANLNGDADADVLPNTVEAWAVSGAGGADRIGLQGGLGTGAPFVSGVGPATEVYLEGDSGNDLITGGPGRETFYGWGGNDSLKGGGGNDLMYGGTGADRLDGGPEGDGLYPGAGNDVVIGGGGRDAFGAESTSDGADDFRGGPGIDNASYFDRAATVRVDLDGNADDGGTGEHDNIRPDVENVDGGSGADRLVGNGLANSFSGWDGADRLVGGGGDDELVGDVGADNLSGGPGDDFLDAGSDPDVLNGGADDDLLTDGTGADTVNGGGGNDDVNQGSSANGSDVISGGGGQIDQVLYSSRVVAVNVSVNNSADDGAAGELDDVRSDVEVVVGGLGGDTLTGNGINNILVGGPNTDTITGAEGADRLFGEAGIDFLDGGLGFDYLDGGSENDTVIANDNARDEVDGGAGALDDCNTDAALDLVSGCEI
jgi:Ca2+-binding RTX toxin-like protein